MAETKQRELSPRERLDAKRSALWADRSSYEQQWRDVATFLMPTRPRWTVSDKARGDRRNLSIINNTATRAANTLRSGLHAGLTSPARPWMKLSTPDPSLAQKPGVASWLAEVTRRMHAIFQLSNIYNAFPMLYGDVATFGTGAVAILEDEGSGDQPGDLFRAQVFPVGSFAVQMDGRGRPSLFIHETSKTVEQIVEEFGGPNGKPLEHKAQIDWSRISTAVKDLWERGLITQRVTTYWAVYRNRDYSANALGAKEFPWASCHWESGAEDHKLLRESGFREFPVMCPRWMAVPDEAYANDYPGITALGDVKQLQMMERKKGQAIEKMVNPALVGPVNLQTQKVSLLPGAVTYIDIREGMQGLRPIHEVRPDLTAFVMDAQAVERRIDSAFYVDLFLMLTLSSANGAQPPTAREVEERHEEKMLVLGPVLESMIDELLDPVVDRVFAMMLRAGLIPEPPKELGGVTLTVEYISILAQAMKMQQVGVLDRFVQSSTLMAQTFPEVTMAVDARRIVRNYQDALGLDPEIVRTDDEIDAMVQAQQEAAQAQQAAEQAQLAARATKDMGTTPMGANGGTVLDHLAGAM